MSTDKLVYMANQIGKFFTAQGGDKAAPSIAEHLKKFWEPRMRAQILAAVGTEAGAGLSEIVSAALTAHRALLQPA